MFLRLLPSFLRRSPQMIHRLANRSSDSQSTNEPPRVRLHPGQQFSLEEIAQGIPEQNKRDIEQLYEFEKLEINNSSVTRDEYRHHIKRLY